MKIALGIEYDGHALYGWQFQENLPTVQGYLETALSLIADEPIKVFCAGRTDAGVHATGQVVHFETTAERVDRAWLLGVNTHLPSGIAVRWMQKVPDDFHARFSAQARRYRYIILNHSLRPALHSARVTWHYYPLDAERMQKGALHLIGEHDFSSLRSARCDAKHPVRTIQALKVIRQSDYIVIEIQANAFLHHMVRNIAGVLMEVGSGFKDPDWVLDVLNAKDRRCAAETAPPQGLYLTDVFYPDEFGIPKARNSLLFL